MRNSRLSTRLVLVTVLLGSNAAFAASIPDIPNGAAMAETIKSMTRSQAVIDAQIKLQESQNKLMDLKNKATPTMGMQGALPTQPNQITPRIYVQKIASFDGKASAKVSYAGGETYLTIGDKLDGVGKVASITIKGVVMCLAKKCTSYPVTGTAMMVSENVTANPNLPPAPPSTVGQ